jgi:hypothetical protein
MEIIKSTRFQALVVIAILSLLEHYGVVTTQIYTALVTILAGHVGIRTVDRLGEKIGK